MRIRETVVGETFASRAISLIVTIRILLVIIHGALHYAMRSVKRQAEHYYNLCYRKNGTGSRSEMDIRERIVIADLQQDIVTVHGRMPCSRVQDTVSSNRIFSDSRQVKQKN